MSPPPTLPAGRLSRPPARKLASCWSQPIAAHCPCGGGVPCRRRVAASSAQQRPCPGRRCALLVAASSSGEWWVATDDDAMTAHRRRCRQLEHLKRRRVRRLRPRQPARRSPPRRRLCAWRRQDKADGLGGRFALGGGVTRLALLLRCDGAADRARREARSGGGGGRRARARACSGATRAQQIGVVQFLPLGGHGGGGSRNSRGVGGVMRAGGALQKWLWQASAAARLGRARHDAEEGDPAGRARAREPRFRRGGFLYYV